MVGRGAPYGPVCKGRCAMGIVGEALSALGQIVAIVVAVLIAPLIFMIVFSLVTGFDDRLPRGD